MSGDTQSRPVTVGVVDKQQAALAYAAVEARRAGCGLEVLHAYTVPPAPPDGVTSAYGFDIPGSFRESGREVLDHAVELLVSDFPELEVETLLVEGAAAGALVKQSERARLVVLGPDDALPWYSRLFVSRVSCRLAGESSSPVVVVPDTWLATDPANRVTLMVDSDTVAHGPLRFVFETAASRDAYLLIVHVASPDGLATETVAWQGMVAVIDSWAGRFPEVSMRIAVIRGVADLQTAESLEHTNLLVLGREHEDRILAGLRRSLAERVIESARCPVAVVPARYDG